MRNSSEFDWFQDDPDWIDELDWVQPAEDTLGPRPIEKYLYFYFWLNLADNTGVDLDSDVVSKFDSAKTYGVILETKCSVLSKDSAKCIPRKLHLKLSLTLTEDEEGKQPITDSPSIVAAWPSPELTPPIDITRSTSNKGELSFKSEKIASSAGLSGVKAWEEKFQRYLPKNTLFVGGEQTEFSRRVIFCVRSTETNPSIEQPHYSGLWATHNKKSFLQIKGEATVWADTKSLIGRRSYELQSGSKSWVFELFRKSGK